MNNEEIAILPDFIANKIAAGEVVQRPASVLKELVENSLDAGAKNIDVYIKSAGKNLIQVVDDGKGMSALDAIKCIQRHATSKIKTVEDLDKILTYGFRGEALSSIAAVSRIEIRTEKYNDELGTSIKFDDETGLVTEKGSFAKGTSVSVKNLFYNTPARRNFLKGNSTELKHLIETFKRNALSQSDVAFKFYNDDELVFDYPAANNRNRIEDVIAENIYDAVVEVHEITDLIEITGCVAKPAYLRRSKGEQYLFINNRYVSSRIVNHAVFTAYENILERGDYPFFVLYLKLDPTKIDINVHPSKLEVKFDDEKTIHSLVNAVVRKGLGKYDLVPSIDLNRTDRNSDRLSYSQHKFTEKNDFSDRPVNNENTFTQKGKGIFSEAEIDLLFNSLDSQISKTTDITSNQGPLAQTSIEVAHTSSEQIDLTSDKLSGESSFIVLLHNKYILSQIKSGLMIIDQHVAHERILYEKAIKSFDSDIPFSQQLLFSEKIQFDPADYELLKEIEDFIIKLGFTIKFLGRRTIEIIGVPSDVNIGSESDTLIEILKEFRKNQIEKQLEVRDNLAKSFSCKTAIKAGDKLTEHEMRLLVDQLFATSMPYVCPHGRPIVIKIQLSEFDKRFGRT